MPNLFDPITLGALELKNRIVMAPMTRSRADDNGVQTDMAPEYYGHRATAGLIITEATQIAEEGGGLFTPGIYNDAQVKAWGKVTEAVHAKGGKIVAQLWHVGRITTPALTKGKPAKAPSAIQANAETFSPGGMEPCMMPEAFTEAEILAMIEQFGHAAEQAKAAGFDGVEIHGANGYLIEQFLQDRTNQRNDAWGGDAANRVRFMTRVVERVLKVWDAGQIGMRFSPLGKFNDMGDSDPVDTYGTAIEALNPYRLAYLHVVETFPGSVTAPEEQAILDQLRAKWTGQYMVNGGFDKDSGNAAVSGGRADVVAIGRPFLSTPDLVERYRKDVPLNPLDEATIYGGDSHGYIDYPLMSDTAATV